MLDKLFSPRLLRPFRTSNGKYNQQESTANDESMIESVHAFFEAIEALPPPSREVILQLIDCHRNRVRASLRETESKSDRSRQRVAVLEANVGDVYFDDDNHLTVSLKNPEELAWLGEVTQKLPKIQQAIANDQPIPTHGKGHTFGKEFDESDCRAAKILLDKLSGFRLQIRRVTT